MAGNVLYWTHTELESYHSFQYFIHNLSLNSLKNTDCFRSVIHSLWIVSQVYFVTGSFILCFIDKGLLEFEKSFSDIEGQSVIWGDMGGLVFIHVKSIPKLVIVYYLYYILYLRPTQLHIYYISEIFGPQEMYRKTSNISRTLVGNKIVYNSDVVGASPVGAAPTTSSFST